MKTREVKITGCKSHNEIKIHLCHFLVWMTSGLEPTSLSISSFFPALKWALSCEFPEASLRSYHRLGG